MHDTTETTHSKREYWTFKSKMNSLNLLAAESYARATGLSGKPALPGMMLSKSSWNWKYQGILGNSKNYWGVLRNLKQCWWILKIMEYSGTGCCQGLREGDRSEPPYVCWLRIEIQCNEHTIILIFCCNLQHLASCSTPEYLFYIGIYSTCWVAAHQNICILL